MIKISGFSMIHNAISGGYPLLEVIQSVQPFVDEMVVVDMESTDDTRKLLEAFDIKIIDGVWDKKAGVTLANAHALNSECKHEIIIHAEADEVYSQSLLEEIDFQLNRGEYNLAVYRLQLEQNFQRCRWYPEPVHRVFPKGSVVKLGHTTHYTNPFVISPNAGFLWDCTNIFRDNWKARILQQSELRGEEPNLLKVPLHVNGSKYISNAQIEVFLEQDHWTWITTPFDIPEILKPLVGQTKYNPFAVK